jgi:peptide/nickel transport system permease protein
MSMAAVAGRRAYRQRPKINLPLAVGLLILLAVVLAAVFAPLLAPVAPTRINLAAVRKAPSLLHPFGTDGVGRDVFSRVLFGGRVSLLVSAIGMLGSLLTGTVMGLLSALGGRIVRWAVDRLIDVQLAFPYVLLAIAITSAVQPSIPVLILLMVLAGWAGAARVVRGVALQERGKDYVKAATVVGVPPLRIALRHVLPSIIPSIEVLAAMQMAAMIVFEATLSFLGMGIQPPQPSWGGIMLDGKDYVTDAWWLTALPGLAIVVTSLALVLIGDGLQARAGLQRLRATP